MPVKTTETTINAPAEVAFNLARSIDLHKISTAYTKEEAVDGKTRGLIGLGESVTWRAKHFGITQLLTSKITEFNYPCSFTDEMVSGTFKSFKHSHLFKHCERTTVMTDTFDYKSPLGFLGRAADYIFLENYMHKLLTVRNTIIKQYAEDPELYKKVLPLL